MTEADRERCARVADGVQQEAERSVHHGDAFYAGVAQGAKWCSKGIRALPLPEPKRGDEDVQRITAAVVEAHHAED